MSCPVCSDCDAFSPPNPRRYARLLFNVTRDGQLLKKNREIRILQDQAPLDSIWVKSRTKPKILLFQKEFEIILK